MKIYIDQNYHCYTSMSKDLREFDVPFFDNKCNAFIEGYRFIPQGETWQRADGVVFHGEMITPFVNAAALQKAQEQYEADLIQMQDMQTALDILGVKE